MATKYADLLIQIVGDVGDVNPPQVEITFRRCLKSFMEKSQVWRTRFSTDLSAATPDPGTRDTLMTAYLAAQAAADAAPNDLVLAQAAATARAAAYARPELTLARPIKTAAVVGPPAVAEVDYNAIATCWRCEYRGQEINQYVRVNAPDAAGNPQTLDILAPVAQLPNGPVVIYLYWTPIFDSDTDLACPDWVYERYGDILSQWTVGELWTMGRGNRMNRQLGMTMRNNAMIDALRVLARVNAEDPIAIAM